MQLAVPVQAGKGLLAQSFVQDDRDGIGKVQRAGVAEHGNPDAVRLVFHEDFLGDAGALFSKHQVVIFSELHVGVALMRLRGQIPDHRGRILRAEFVKILPGPHFQARPVIEAGASDPLFFNGEAHGFDQVQIRAGRDAGAADVSGVLGDFRFVKNDVHDNFLNQTQRQPTDAGGKRSCVYCSSSSGTSHRLRIS